MQNSKNNTVCCFSPSVTEPTRTPKARVAHFGEPLPQARQGGEHMLNSGQNTVLLAKLCRKTKSVLIGAQTIPSITVKFYARRMSGAKSVQTIGSLLKPVGANFVRPLQSQTNLCRKRGCTECPPTSLRAAQDPSVTLLPRG